MVETKRASRLQFDSLVERYLFVLSVHPEKEKLDLEKIKTDLKNYILENSKGNHEFNGCKLPPLFHKNSAKWQYEEWEPNPGDVIVATHPKTGTTWVREIARQLLYKDNEEQLNISEKLSTAFCYLEKTTASLNEIYLQLPFERRIYGTHMQAVCLNIKKLKERGCKIIYVMRNPKDTCVSYYHFSKKLPLFNEGDLKKAFPDDWNGFFEAFISGQQPNFSRKKEWYPHHILSYYPYRNDDNVLFVQYEDLKQDPAAKIQEIAKFIECETENILDVVNATTLSAMKKLNIPDTGILRKGVVGDWKNYFTVAQSELMDEEFNKVLSNVDIKFTYE